MEDIISELRQISEQEDMKLFNVKEMAEKMRDMLKTIKSEIGNLTPEQKKLLYFYQYQCRYLGIGICYNIKEALSHCAAMHAVIYVTDVDIYILIKDKSQYDQFISMDARAYDEPDMPEPQDTCYQIILGSAPQSPLLVFHKNDHPEDTIKKLNEYFKCQVEWVKYGDKIQYSVDKKYSSHDECMRDIKEFLKINHRTRPPILEEMPVPIPIIGENHLPLSYLKYAIPRSRDIIKGGWPQNITINQNICIVNGTMSGNVKFNAVKNHGKKYATDKQMRDWIANNPPTTDIRRADYLEMAKNELGAIKIKDFTHIIQEQYVEKRNGIHYWEKINK